jgi:hypothetical protein
MLPPNRSTHRHLSLRVRSIFYFGRFQVMVDYVTEPFVLHTRLLRRSQLKNGKIIDNHIANKKCQRILSKCCNLWTTKETYQKLLWNEFYTTLLLHSANPFWIGFCKNLVFFPDSFFSIFFFIKIEYPL